MRAFAVVLTPESLSSLPSFAPSFDSPPVFLQMVFPQNLMYPLFLEAFLSYLLIVLYLPLLIVLIYLLFPGFQISLYLQVREFF